MDGSYCAFLDASVLDPVTLRNFLMRLTLNGFFQAHWSKHVHEEWIRVVLRDHPDIPAERGKRAEDARRRIWVRAVHGAYPSIAWRSSATVSTSPRRSSNARISSMVSRGWVSAAC